MSDEDPAEVVPIFVITIDPRRYEDTAADLRSHGFRPRPYRGVNGVLEETRLRADVTPFARHLSPDKVLGTTLSHLQLARDLAAAWPPGAAAVLVLEDDALVSGATPEHLVRLAGSSETWDALRVYCQGLCAPEARLFSGSAAAYLLSERGARRMATFRAVYFSDMQLSSSEMVTYNGPKLFTTRDPRSSLLLVGDQPMSFWLRQPFLRSPVGGSTVSLGGAALVLAVLAALGWVLRRACPLSVCVCGGALLAALVALYGRAHGFGVVRRGREGRVAGTTLGAGLAVVALVVLLGNGERIAWTWALPVLLVLEMGIAMGVMGLATVH